MAPSKSKTTSVKTRLREAQLLWQIQAADVEAMDDMSLDDMRKALSSIVESYDGLKKATAAAFDTGSSDYLVEAGEQFHSLRKELNKSIEDSTEVKVPPPAQGAEKRVTEFTHSHIKKISCPIWDGQARSLPRFRKNFNILVESCMSSELALIRLREEAVRPNTREHLIIRSQSTLAQTWQALEDAYGRSEIVKNSILRDIRALKPVHDLRDAAGLRLMVTELTSAREDLKACNRESALGESAFSVVMEKVPEDIRREVDMKVLAGDRDLDSTKCFEIFIQSCEKYASAEEMHQLRCEAHSSLADEVGFDFNSDSKTLQMKVDDQQSPKDQGQGQDNKSGHKRRSGDWKKGEGKGAFGKVKDSENGSKEKSGNLKVCILHPDSGTHNTALCKIFLDTSADDKKALLEKAKKCVKCFGDHATNECMSTHDCKEPRCKDPKTHHTLVHAACLTVVSKGPFSATKSLTERQFGLQLGHYTVRPSHYAYLKKSKKEKVRTTILYDLGATLSQVLNSVACKIGLRPVNMVENLMMKTAGSQASANWGPSNLYNVPLYDENGVLTMVVKCVGVDYIGELDGGSYQKVASHFEKNGLEVGNLLEPAHGTVEILVGDNHAGSFPKPIHARGDVILAETLFGALLHGAHLDFFPAHQNVEGISMSTAIDDFVSKAGSCWLIQGPGKDDSTVESGKGTSTVEARSAKVCSVKVTEETAFDRMCKLEDSPICYNCGKCSQTDEEERRLEVYRSCLKYDAEKKIFICQMPWIENFESLPDNRPAAMKRLTSLTKSMARDSNLKEWYVSEFEKLKENDFMIEVTESEDCKWKRDGGKVFYISHFAHLSESSSSTPLRVIFDASVPFRGVAINSLWESPPNLIPPIPLLIVRFRERRVPVAMDISKAYMSVHLETIESHLHRLLWNKLDANGQVKTMRMLRNSWGMKPAGGLCSVAMLMIAEKYRKEFPEVYTFIRDNLYVDDGTSSVDDVSTALRLARNTSHVLSQASFKVKHFIICGSDIDVSSADINSENLSSIVRNSDRQERVLGVLYHSEEDEISIMARVNFSKRKRGARLTPDVQAQDFDESFPENFSLRMYLSVVASIYDPAGLSSPVTIVLKHELGRIFALKLGWDKPIPDDGDITKQTSKTRCKELVKTIYDLMKIRFIRCLQPSSSVGDPTLVIFCDSSQNAYACVCYYNWQVPGGTRQSRLVMAKARPWPKSPVLTVPRGELMACVLGVRMKNSIVARASFKFTRTVMITDSTIVLGQMRHAPSRYNIWTANRLDEIQRLSQTSDWFHVESALNVADDATRGLAASEIGKDSRWQIGPEFLTFSEADWPIKPFDRVHGTSQCEPDVDQRLKDPRMDMRKVAQHDNCVSTVFLTKADASATATANVIAALEKLEIPAIDKNARWTSAKRRIARIIRFLENCPEMFRRVKIKKEAVKPAENLNSQQRTRWFSENDKFVPTKRELTIAGLYLVKQAQSYLPEDVERKLGSLNPEKDSDGLWRFTGRGRQVLENPPIMIPRSHPLSEVLIRHYHEPQHSGADATLALLRQEFWVIDGARATNSYVFKCAACRMLRKKTVEVEIAPKKTQQLTRSPVFRHVTLDLAGPYITVADRRTSRGYSIETGKVWILVIVCRASGAVHMELLEGYDTKSFLSGYDAFTKLRGKPETVTADLGSQIRSAANVLESLWKHTDKSKIQTDPENTEWMFVPSGAHSSLGQAERMIRTIKITMEAVTRSRKPRLQKLQFQRLLYHIADLVNDRPLGIHRRRAGELGSDRLLRPNDLILGRSNANLANLMNEDSPNSEHTEMLAINEAIVNEWWRKWYELVFHNLLPREKWTKSGRSVMKGDIVLIKEENPIRNKWSWGEVHAVNQSSDGICRTVSVRYKDDSGRSRYVHKSVRDLVVILENDDNE